VADGREVVGWSEGYLDFAEELHGDDEDGHEADDQQGGRVDEAADHGGVKQAHHRGHQHVHLRGGEEEGECWSHS
jgi:hypothetical protein